MKELVELGGSSLLKSVGSIYSLVSEVYPDYDWLPWQFGIVPENFWNDMKNQRKFMDWASEELKIKEKTDWYKLTQGVTLP
jgi:hypothetical protein